MPTAQRNPAALLVRRGGDKLLFDCGEGTQRQLLRSGVGLIELEEVFITHFHADHVLGLPGMMKTFALRGRERPLTVYGPPGLRALFNALHPIVGRTTYEVSLVELEPNQELERDGYRIAAFETTHRVRAYGYALVEDKRLGRFDERRAAELARAAEVKLLALTHVSPRYAGPDIRDEARAVFERTIVPRDFDRIEIPFPERGDPLHVKVESAR